MVTLLHLVSYGAAVAAFVFVTLSLASGLLWLAEAIEEHSRAAKIIGKRTIYAVIVFHALLYFVDSNLPPFHTIFSIACHLVYLLNLNNFPTICLTSWSFMASCLLVVADHFIWFFHFSEINEAARRRERRWRHPMEPVPHVPSFFDIATFFGICIWLVPLFLFLSLQAGENALPTARRHDSHTPVRVFDGSQPSLNKPQHSSLFVSLSSRVMSPLFALRLSRGRSRKDSDGIIAPRSSSRPSSPLHFGPPPQSPRLHRRSTSSESGTSVGTLIPTASPTHSPAMSPTSTTFGTGSWIPVEDGSHLTLPPSTQGTRNELGDENVTRRRVSIQKLPLR